MTRKGSSPPVSSVSISSSSSPSRHGAPTYGWFSPLASLCNRNKRKFKGHRHKGMLLSLTVNPRMGLFAALVVATMMLFWNNIQLTQMLIFEQSIAPDVQTFARVAEKWDRVGGDGGGGIGGASWYHHPIVVSTFKSRLAAGSPNEVSHLKLNYGVFEKCISVGCGDGNLEIEMVQSGLCRYMRGIDLSPKRIERARKSIPPNLDGQIEFVVENAETDLHDKNYDLVLFSHALKHIFELNSFAEMLQQKVLRKAGIIVIIEYVGASRFQFPQTQLDLMTKALKGWESSYPDYTKVFLRNTLWDGHYFRAPDEKGIQRDDPSETVHSNQIVPILHNYFSLVEDNPLGGNFFQFIFDGCYDGLLDDAGNRIVAEMLEEEMRLIKAGHMSSDYVFQVWKHKPKGSSSYMVRLRQ